MTNILSSGQTIFCPPPLTHFCTRNRLLCANIEKVDIKITLDTFVGQILDMMFKWLYGSLTYDIATVKELNKQHMIETLCKCYRQKHRFHVFQHRYLYGMILLSHILT